MDDLSRVREHTSDVSAAQESQRVLWQAGGRPRNAARRRPRKAGPSRPMPSRQPDVGEAPAPPADGADVPEASADGQNRAAPCYRPDKSLTPTAPSKGKHIDIAI